MSNLRSVFVTGASSGIGSATACRLRDAGWSVYAGVRRAGSEPAGTTPITLDVSDESSIRSAAMELSAALGERGLDALVNNAGVGQVAPVECVPLSEFRKVFEVNVFGLVGLTQALLPLLRKTTGRIVNLSSVGGLITIPFGSALCATKHAVEAINEAMRMELAADGIKVIAIRPASIASPAANKLAEDTSRIIAGLSPEHRERYGESLGHFVEVMQEDENHGSPPDVVAEAIQTALESIHPAFHYSVGKHATLLNFLAKWVPEELRDNLLEKKLGLATGRAEPAS